jgi:hypothetical protein
MPDTGKRNSHDERGGAGAVRIDQPPLPMGGEAIQPLGLVVPG